MTDTSPQDAAGNSRGVWEFIWDLPVRAFHWLLAIAVAVGWYLGDNRSFSNIDYHFYIGYFVGGLVVLRLIWGFIGPKPARLSSLFHSIPATFAYLLTIPRREPSGTPGHNPIGSLSVLALLVSLLVQVGTGLFAEDDGLFSAGPLSGYLSGGMVAEMNAIHYWNSRILLFLVGTHVFAVLFYLVWKRENLIRPMFTGIKYVKRTTNSDTTQV